MFPYAYSLRQLCRSRDERETNTVGVCL